MIVKASFFRNKDSQTKKTSKKVYFTKRKKVKKEIWKKTWCSLWKRNKSKRNHISKKFKKTILFYVFSFDPLLFFLGVWALLLLSFFFHLMFRNPSFFFCNCFCFSRCFFFVFFFLHLLCFFSLVLFLSLSRFSSKKISFCFKCVIPFFFSCHFWSHLFVSSLFCSTLFSFFHFFGVWRLKQHVFRKQKNQSPPFHPKPPEIAKR